jgi:hypothetical protein
VRAASSYQSRNGTSARAEIADPKMPHIGKLHLNPPYAEAIEHYSMPSEPLAKNRRTAPAINGAMEITFNCGQSSSGWLTVSVTNTSRTAG